MIKEIIYLSEYTEVVQSAGIIASIDSTQIPLQPLTFLVCEN